MLSTVFIVLMVAAGTATAATASAPVSVVIREEVGDEYAVEGAFEVSAPTEAVWAVLTDYERLDDFVESVKTSVVLERTPDRIVVEQDGIAKILVFSKRAHVVLWVTEDAPRRIRFRDVCGRDFASYEGRWELEARPGGVRVSYFVSATLKPKKPAFLVRALMQKTARALLEEVRAEIGRRPRDVSPPARTSAIK